MKTNHNYDISMPKPIVPIEIRQDNRFLFGYFKSWVLKDWLLGIIVEREEENNDKHIIFDVVIILLLFALMVVAVIHLFQWSHTK